MKIEKGNGEKKEKGCFGFVIFSVGLIFVALLLSNISTGLTGNVNKVILIFGKLLKQEL